MALLSVHAAVECRTVGVDKIPEGMNLFRSDLLGLHGRRAPASGLALSHSPISLALFKPEVPGLMWIVSCYCYYEKPGFLLSFSNSGPTQYEREEQHVWKSLRVLYVYARGGFSRDLRWASLRLSTDLLGCIWVILTDAHIAASKDTQFKSDGCLFDTNQIHCFD